MEPAVITTITIAAITMIGNALYFSVWGTWKVANAQAAIKADITAAITNHKKEVAESFEAHQRMLGETISALRQKINEVELYVRDHFVRSDEFAEGMRAITLTMNRMDDSIGSRLGRMEIKIDDAAKEMAAAHQR